MVKEDGAYLAPGPLSFRPAFRPAFAAPRFSFRGPGLAEVGGAADELLGGQEGQRLRHRAQLHASRAPRDRLRSAEVGGSWRRGAAKLGDRVGWRWSGCGGVVVFCCFFGFFLGGGGFGWPEEGRFFWGGVRGEWGEGFTGVNEVRGRGGVGKGLRGLGLVFRDSLSWAHAQTSTGHDPHASLNLWGKMTTLDGCEG